jgi:hypothetical protein
MALVNGGPMPWGKMKWWERKILRRQMRKQMRIEDRTTVVAREQEG